MTQAYIEGFSKTAEVYGVDPSELLKLAFSAPVAGSALTAGGVGAVGAGLGAGLGSAATGGLGTPLVAGGVYAGAPLLAGGAGLLIGDALRRGADAVTKGGFTRRTSNVGSRVGSAVGSWFQRLSDASRASKKNDALHTEAMNAYNKSWHQFAPEHSPENFGRFKEQYLKSKQRRAATRVP